MASMYLRAVLVFFIIFGGIHVANPAIVDAFIKEGMNVLITKALPKIASFIGIAQPEDTATIKDYINSATKSVMDKLQEIHSDLKDSLLLNEKMVILNRDSVSILSALDHIAIYMRGGPDNEVQNRKTFMDHYESNEVHIKVLELPKLLTEDILDRKNLLSLVLDPALCNITKATSFFQYCARLVSYGVLAEVLFTKERFNNSESELSKVVGYWTGKDQDMFNVFMSTIDTCKKKWELIAQQDLSNAPDAVQLWNTNNKWSPWLYNDVVFLPKSSVIHPYSHTEKRSVLIDTSHGPRYSIFYNSETVEHGVPSEIFTSGRLLYANAIRGNEDVHSTKHICEAVEAHLSDKGYRAENIIVLFDESDEVTEIIAPGSPLLTLNLGSYTMKTPKSVSGKFKVYAYIENKVTGAVNKKGFQTNAGISLSGQSSLFAIMTLISINVSI